MAQTRYPNVLPYMPSHSVNGASERMKEREKAHLARERNVDHDGKKVPSFPSPIRVEENDDGISAFVKNVLGDFKKFKRIMSTEKVPTCIGVVPVPATPTEPKSYFGSSNEKDKDKKRPPQKKKEVRPTEQLEPKPSSDLSKHKVHRSTEKSNFAEYKAKEKESNDANESKLDNKDRQRKGIDKSNVVTNGVNDRSHSPNKTEITTGGKVHDERTSVKTVNKSEASNETTHQSSSKIKAEPLQPPQKIRPTPIQIPARDNNSASDVQSVHHNDMKVQNILKEMTEPVAQPPLTGICTPVLKKIFPFAKGKDDQIISNFKSPLYDDVIRKNAEHKDEQETTGGQEDSNRMDDYSSSSCSSSSEESGSSDSEGEEENRKTAVPKLSNLNAISPSVHSTPASSVLDKPKAEKPEGENNHGGQSLPNIISTNDVPASDSNVENSSNQNTSLASTKGDITMSDGRTKRNISEKEKSNIHGEEQSVKPFLESTSDEDKKPKIESKMQLKDESLTVKTDNLTKLVKLEAKEQRNEKAEVGGQVHGKESPVLCVNKLNDERILHETLKNKKIKENRKEKDKEREKKVSKLKTETFSDSKKSKHKTKHKLSEQREPKRKVETLSSKKNNLTKSVSKDFTEQSKKVRSKLDNESDEDSEVDVVSCESPVKKKKKEKFNGQTKNGHNGHHEIPLDIEVIHDPEKEPKSLLVRIDLSLLNRIPKKAIGHSSRISVGSTLTGEHTHEKHGDGKLSSIAKDDKETTQTETEQTVKRKENTVISQEKNSEQADKKKHQGGHNKRSPSSERHQNKRFRRDSEKSTHDRHKSRKTMAEQNAEVDEEIKKASPDTHLQQAKTLKREADKLTDKEAKSRTYVEAIIHFICCGRALEGKEETEPRAAQMYSETEDLLKFVLKRVLSKSEDKRLIILCLRLQSLLLHKLYRVKSRQALKNSQILAEHFKATHKNNITSPYTANKHASTPSPMSPTPSPAGSIGSIGSSSSSDGNNGSSQNGRPLPPSASVTSPVSISIPQRIHTAMSQHVSTTTKLLHSIDIWDTADNLASNYQEFFSSMDSQCGALTFHSSIAHVVNYVRKSLSKLHDRGKET